MPHGPVVLAAHTRMPGDDKLCYLADDSRTGQIASGPTCPLAPAPAPMFVSDSTGFNARFKPVAGKPPTFTAPGLVPWMIRFARRCGRPPGAS